MPRFLCAMSAHTNEFPNNQFRVFCQREPGTRNARTIFHLSGKLMKNVPICINKYDSRPKLGEKSGFIQKSATLTKIFWPNVENLCFVSLEIELRLRLFQDISLRIINAFLITVSFDQIYCGRELNLQAQQLLSKACNVYTYSSITLVVLLPN